MARAFPAVPAVNTDEFWAALRAQASRAAAREPALTAFLTRSVLRHDSFPSALAGYLSAKIAGNELAEEALATEVFAVYRDYPGLAESAVADLTASCERNPAYGDHL